MPKPCSNYKELIDLWHEIKKSTTVVRQLRIETNEIRKSAPQDQRDDLFDVISCICEASDELQRALDALDELAHQNAPDRIPD